MSHVAWERPTLVLRVIREPRMTSEWGLVWSALCRPCLWGHFAGDGAVAGRTHLPSREAGHAGGDGGSPPRGVPPWAQVWRAWARDGAIAATPWERRAGQQEPRWAERDRAGPMFQL